jgi:hypothetical protein
MMTNGAHAFQGKVGKGKGKAHGSGKGTANQKGLGKGKAQGKASPGVSGMRRQVVYAWPAVRGDVSQGAHIHFGPTPLCSLFTAVNLFLISLLPLYNFLFLLLPPNATQASITQAQT